MCIRDRKSEEARISTAEAVGVAEENKNRQIIVAVKNKERTNAVETERVERDRQLEVTERERLVGVAQVEKDKAMEVVEREKQEVIRERVVVERGTVEEREKIKDTEAFYGADRQKKVSIVSAEEKAQEALVTEVKAAEASKQSASLLAEKTVIEAEAARAASEKEMQATKMLAEARTADSAAEGLAEAQVRFFPAVRRPGETKFPPPLPPVAPPPRRGVLCSFIPCFVLGLRFVGAAMWIVALG